MTKNHRVEGFLDAWKLTLSKPWAYPTYPVVSTLFLMQAIFFSRIQQTLWIAWVPELSAKILICVVLIVTCSSVWLNVSKRIISTQNKPIYKCAIFYISNALWTIPNYLILKAFVPDPLQPFPIAGLKLFVGLTATQFFWTLITNQINRELLAKEALVKELVRQRTQIIESEEETRQLVSKYLHNNLQSGLVVINHQLGEAIKDLPEATRGRFQSILQELELMRKVEIRDASRALSPNLDVLNLEALVQPLLDVYKASMKVSVKSDQIEYSSVKHIALAIYRIVEQVLLNATVHGHARNATVAFRIEDSSIRLTISNDGKPIDVEAKAFGTGTAIIDTWVSSLEGEWKIALNAESNTSFDCKLAI